MARPGLRRVCSAAQPLLLREYLHNKLYHPHTGYFTRRSVASPVGELSAPIPFAHLLSRSEYGAHVEAAYLRSGCSWFTPVELLRPWYGRALASHILRKHQPALGPLRIYELGGGTGRAAYDVLSAIAVSNPAVYASLSYVSVEISAELAAKQAATCRPHAARFRVEHRDASTEWTPDATPCFVLGLEVLDNLPHDRVVRVDGQWHETRVLDNFEECLSPVADPLIARCLSHYRPSFLASRSGIVFLPTTALRLLEALQLARPNAHLLFADFDYLPGIRIPGVYAPLVASQRGGGTTTDHDSYLGSEPADVFFPTDFSMLQRMAGARGNVRKSAQFFEETLTGEELRQCSTASGFNPLLDDFPNTRFFTT